MQRPPAPSLGRVKGLADAPDVPDLPPVPMTPALSAAPGLLEPPRDPRVSGLAPGQEEQLLAAGASGGVSVLQTCL